jgi:hypothetical protein
MERYRKIRGIPEKFEESVKVLDTAQRMVDIGMVSEDVKEAFRYM